MPIAARWLMSMSEAVSRQTYMTPIRAASLPPGTLVVLPEEGVVPGLVDLARPMEHPTVQTLDGLARGVLFTMTVGMAVVALGGGRTMPTDSIDHTVGFDRLLDLGARADRLRPRNRRGSARPYPVEPGHRCVCENDLSRSAAGVVGGVGDVYANMIQTGLPSRYCWRAIRLRGRKPASVAIEPSRGFIWTFR